MVIMRVSLADWIRCLVSLAVLVWGAEWFYHKERIFVSDIMIALAFVLLLTPLLWSRYLRRYEILYLIAPCLASGIAAIFAWSSDKRDRRDSILFALFSATYVYPLLRRVIRNLRNRRASIR